MNYKARPSRRSSRLLGLYLKGLLGAVALCAALWALAHFGVLGAAVATLLGLVAICVCLAAPEAIRATTLYEIREGEVRSSYGIINRREESMRVGAVLSSEVQQTIIERFVLRTGTAVFSSGATHHATDDIQFWGISSPSGAVAALRSGQSGVSPAPVVRGEEPAETGVRAGQSPAASTGPAQMPPMDGGGLPPR